MFNRAYVAAALLTALAFLPSAPALAQGEVLITQAKAIAGNITPGDTAGFPILLSRTGSYKLAGNLDVSANQHGILVTATEVSIDLNQFRLNGGNVAEFGIVGNQRGLSVRNGTVAFFKHDGIFTRGALMIVENMRISENGGRGVREYGTSAGFARFVNSTVFGNRLGGIDCRQGCHVEGNNIARNGAAGAYNGVYMASGTALGNTIIANTAYGLSGVANQVGFGNNTIIGNSYGPVTGGLTPLHPNACSPQAC